MASDLTNIYRVTYALQVALSATNLSSILDGCRVAFYRKEKESLQSYVFDIIDSIVNSSSYCLVSGQPVFHFDKFSFLNLFNYENTKYFYDFLSEILSITNSKTFF